VAEHETNETDVRGQNMVGWLENNWGVSNSGMFQVFDFSIAEFIHIYRPSNNNKYQYSLLATLQNVKPGLMLLSGLLVL